MAREKPKSGGARMMANGKVPSQIWFNKREMREIRLAARVDDRPVASFIRIAALNAAAELLREHDATSKAG